MLLFGLTIIAGIVGLVIGSTLLNKTKIATVNYELLFNDFNLTKELKIKLEQTVKKRHDIIDSLEIELSNTQKLNQQNEHLAQYYSNKKQEFEQLNQVLTSTYDNQIWARINMYLKKYGENNGYEMILATNNNTVILFGAPSLDITQDVELYINECYENGINTHE